MIKDFVDERGLNRELEALPSEKEIRRRTEAGIGLTSPELATLMAHVKLALKDDAAGQRPARPGGVRRPGCRAYFPTTLRDQFGTEIRSHQLRREIVATMLVNDLVDTAGISYAYRVTEDVGVGPVDAVRSYVAADAIFGIGRVWRQIRAAGAKRRVGRGDRPDDARSASAHRPRRSLAAQLPSATAGGGRRDQPVRRRRSPR